MINIIQSINNIREYKLSHDEKVMFLMVYAGAMLVLGVYIGKYFG